MLLNSDTQLNRRSYYEASVRREPPWQSLQGAQQADVLVVGGGFAGLSCALELSVRGYSVVLLEAERVCSGASGRNGGQAIVGYACGQQTLERQLGMADARRAWQMSLEAIELIDQRIKEHGIDCDRVHGYLHVATSRRKAALLRREMGQLQERYGLQLEMAGAQALQGHLRSPLYLAGAYERTSGHLHPLKYGLGLARAARRHGVRIFENSAVTELRRGDQLLARTAQGTVSARFAVLAGNCTLAEHGPRLAPDIAGRIMPAGTYIVATEPMGEEICRRLIPSDAAVSDNNFVLDYFRFSADRRLLFGGRVSYSTHTPAQLQQGMQRRLGRVFPELATVPIEFVWGGFVDISMSRAPDFGRLGPNLYYLQGFSGHGVALTGLAGRLIAESVAGQAERFDLFSRLKHRDFPGGAALRTPTLVLAMLYYRLRDLF